MRNKRFMLYLLGIFIATIILVVYLQYNSSQNIDELIEGNESLLGEYQLKSDVQNLSLDLSYFSQANEKAIHKNSAVDLNEVKARRKKILEDLKHIKQLPLHDSTKKYLYQLEILVNQLLAVVDKELAEEYDDKTGGSATINKDKKEKLALQIITLTNELNNSRNEHLANLVEEADQNGQEAKFWGTILAVVAVITSIFTFWYITNKIKLQQQLIKQLNESEQKVREAASIKENFMANMSHEIRTPMNGILGFTHLLQKQPLNEKSQEFVNSIQNSGENLLAIINDLLDFSKIEAGMMRIESIPFSLRGLLHSIETMFSVRVQVKNLLLTVDVEKSIPDVLKGDAMRLTQIMVNLVSNSLKFTNAGSIEINVTADKQTDNNIRACFSVKDTGIGIPSNKIDTIFERFQQAYEDTTRKYGGTGLGLSIVKQLVELQNGTINVSSVLNKGTEFVFSIPYTITKDITEKEKPAFMPAYVGKLNENNMKILVAEDNAMNQSLMKHLLADWDLDFHIVNNGKEALEALQQKNYGLVLMDIQMPQMDGYMATQKIRNELNSSIPIIAMTAHAMAGEREKCLSYGMNEYVSKPIRENELFKIINNLLRINTSEKKAGLQTADSSSNNFEALDLDYLKELSGGNKAFEVDMIEQFLHQVPDEITAMEKEFTNNNYTAVARIAHNMKTSVSFLGLLEKLGDTLDDIESNSTVDKENAYLKEKITLANRICQKAFLEAEEYLKIIS